ncbi:7TM diverse intracellular signaling domain-containing protein [Pararhodonellum marinum]|uniref:7TM diverse intracellular signaling domain-containing protein n=1 Tax=Pararhodonellum marinum TaxID=2755358 RepID=UPI00188EBEA9|nr:7TM diverse intracellular signaling domain-containing protein [Pararhodonellum marinum]
MRAQLKESKAVLIALTIILFISFPVFYYLNAERNLSEIAVSEFKVFDNNDISQLQQSNFEEISTSFLIFGFTNDPLTLGFNLAPLIKNEGLHILELKNPNFRDVFLYRKQKEGGYHLVETAGTNFGKSNPLSYPNPSFEIAEKEDFTMEYILQVNSVEPVNFTLSLYEKNSFLEKYSKIILFVSIYIGVILALFLYNLILYFMIRDRVYFLYSFYIFFLALAQITLLGFTHEFLFDGDVYLYEVSIIGFSSISGVFGILFLRNFLKTPHYIPRIDKVLIFNIGLYVACLVFRLLSFVELSYFLTDISGLLIATLFIISSFIIARKGVRTAVYFLVAFLMFFFGLVFYILQNRGVIEIGTYANFPILLGSALEAILLSLALADRINLLKREKEMEQLAKLDALSENERLIKEQNLILEEKVKTRTNELELTLKNLQNTQTQLVNQEKMASLGQLTAGIAHEINNPINFVSSNISPLKRDMKDILQVIAAYKEKGKMEFSAATKKELNELEEELELDYLIKEIEQLLRGMEDGAKRTVEIVKGLRLFSRVDEQDVKKVDIHDGINSTLVLLNSSMSGKIQVTKDYADIPMIECLAGKINQVFMNIISNAIHALLEQNNKITQPEITIRTRGWEDHIQIEIQDNGPGMPSHVKERIFEPFFTTKAVGKGTGLGLSIVYTIIENHKGFLEVVTAENQGTTFIIKLPIYQKTVQHEA